MAICRRQSRYCFVFGFSCSPSLVYSICVYLCVLFNSINLSRLCLSVVILSIVFLLVTI